MANNLPSILESLLFIYGEPLSITKLARLSKAKESEVLSALDALSQRLKESGSGLSLLTSGSANNSNKIQNAQLVTRPDLSSYAEQLIKDDFDASLTPAALETLTIICYLGPVSRAQIDLVRGVNSSFILRSLLLRGLILRHPDEKRRYVYLYEPTAELLRHLGLSSISELPDYNKYRGLLTPSEPASDNYEN